MAFNINTYYEEMFNALFSSNSKITIGRDFHAQVKKIDSLLNNDVTGMVTTIYDFMVQCATVPMIFETKNKSLNSIFTEWQDNVNSDVNIDIPRGFRSFSEQYFRERWKSSFIVLNIVWGKVDGYEMPVNMWFSDGASIYAEQPNDALNSTKYFIGKAKQKPLISTRTQTIIIRKPYNNWYDKYPTPYFVKKGTLYHALLKEKILSKQSQGLEQVFPAMLAIKMGCDEAMRRGEMPGKPALDEMKQKFINLQTSTEDRTLNNGLIGAFPYDVKFENLLPEFNKILDEKIVSGTDRNLLMSLGLIEFKGFSTNREESVLNPKPLVSEIEDAVEDFTQLIGDVIYEIRKRNSGTAKKFSAKEVTVGHAPIKALLTDAMKVLIRSLYDRGLVSKEDTVEGTSAFTFAQQVEKRKREIKENLDEIMKAPVILNQDNKDTSDNRTENEPNKEKSPAKKKSEQDVQARLEKLNELEKEIFQTAYTKCLATGELMEVDEDFLFQVAFEFAEKAVDVYNETGK